MKDQELDDFQKKFGYKPTPIATVDRHARGLRPQGQPDRRA
jgi:hypothetical protein